MMNFKKPEIKVHGGEDPGFQSPFAFIQNGPVFWDRAAFEAAVAPEDRHRFVIQRGDEPAMVPAPQPAPAEAETARKAAKAAAKAWFAQASAEPGPTAMGEGWAARAIPKQPGSDNAARWEVYVAWGGTPPENWYTGAFAGSVPGEGRPAEAQIAAVVAAWQNSCE